VDQALTANQGYVLQQQIDTLGLASNVILGGTLDCVSGDVDSTTTDGAAAGLVVNSPLPAPSFAFNDIYVIVTTAGSYDPPGPGGPYNAELGDWFLCGETAPASGIYQWSYLGVGARPAYATTSSPGIIQLAFPADVQAGLNNSLAVTPFSLQSKVSDSTSTTSSTTIASSTAVKAAYDLADAALPESGGTMTGDIVMSGAGVGVVFDDTSTIEAISDSVATTSSVTAASSTAVKSAYDLAVAALPLAGGTMTGTITFDAGQIFPVSGIQDATAGQKGIVQIGTNIQVSSGTISVDTATTGQLGLVQVGTNIDVSAGTISVKSASTTQSGIVQLNDTLASTSTTQALTANMGRDLQVQINALSTSNNLTFAGTIDGATGDMVTVTVEGAAVGFVVNDPLPATSTAINEYFVIVSTTGTMTPPGGVPTLVYVGDWWLASSTAWTYIAAGFQPPYASTTTPGLVLLSTDAETQAGTDATEAVTPASLQSKVSDSTATTSSTTIASSTAVKSAYDLANAAVPCSSFLAKGNILGGTAAGTYGALAVGTNGQFLSANSACSTGLQWCTLSLACVPCSAYTGQGVLLAGTGVSTFSALPVGSAGQVLTPNLLCATGLEWVSTCALNIVGYTCTATPFNTALGATAGDSITTGSNNVAIGINALSAVTTTSLNVAVGACAMDAASGSQNTAVGASALRVVVGSSNVALGTNAGRAATAGSNNTFVGSASGCGIVGGGSNTVLGANALAASSTGVANTVIGTNAMAFGAGSTCNTVVGFEAGRLLAGASNTLLGRCSGSAITTGACNTIVGPFSGSTTLSNNVVLADGAGTVRFQSNQNGAWSPDGTNFGTIGQVLASNGTVAAPSWCTLSLACVPCAAFVACGDLLVGTGSATFAALPTGTNGQSLVVDTTCIATGGLKWVTQTQLCGFTCTATPFNTALGSGAGVAFTVNSVANTAIGYIVLCNE
jgi:hypothetical protein